MIQSGFSVLESHIRTDESEDAAIKKCLPQSATQSKLSTLPVCPTRSPCSLKSREYHTLTTPDGRPAKIKSAVCARHRELFSGNFIADTSLRLPDGVLA